MWNYWRKTCRRTLFIGDLVGKKFTNEVWISYRWIRSVGKTMKSHSDYTHCHVHSLLYTFHILAHLLRLHICLSWSHISHSSLYVIFFVQAASRLYYLNFLHRLPTVGIEKQYNFFLYLLVYKWPCNSWNFLVSSSSSKPIVLYNSIHNNIY